MQPAVQLKNFINAKRRCNKDPADTQLLEELTGYKPNTGLKYGMKSFVKWYREYYKI